MKCTVDKASFLQHLQKAADIVCRKATLPILSNIKLEAAGDELKLTATNLETMIETTLEAVVAEDGATTLPAKSLTDLANRLTGTEIQLESDKNFHCKILCGSAAFKLLGLDPADFPEPFAGEPKSKITLKIADCTRLVDRVAYAVSKDDTRKILQGVLLAVKDGVLTAAATDGKRLATMTLTPDALEGDCQDIVIPYRAALEVRRLLEGDAPVTLAYNERTLSMCIGTTALTAKLIAGSFPDFRRVMPQEYRKTVSLATAPLLASLELVSIPLESGGNVALKFSPGLLGLHGESQSIGEGADTIDIPYQYEDPIQMFFNPEFLREPLKHAGAERLNLRMNDEQSPIALEDGNGFTYILMPLRVR